MNELTDEEWIHVYHWRRWLAQGGTKLTSAPMALKPLLAIIDRLTETPPVSPPNLSTPEK